MRIKCEKHQENIDAISARRFAREVIEPPNTPNTPNGIVAIIAPFKFRMPLVPPASLKASYFLLKTKTIKRNLSVWKSITRISEPESLH